MTVVRRRVWSLAALRARTRSTWPWWRQRRSWRPAVPVFVSRTRQESEMWKWSAPRTSRRGFTAEVEPFFYDMGRRLRAADSIVCRAGATTLAETAAAGKAAILDSAADGNRRSPAQERRGAGGGGRRRGAVAGGRERRAAGQREFWRWLAIAVAARGWRRRPAGWHGRTRRASSSIARWTLAG